LTYSFDALEPYIDARTMEIHHDKHHATYVTRLNDALAKQPELNGQGIEALLADLNAVPEGIRTAVRNNGGGHYNHVVYWQTMGPNGGGEPAGAIGKAIAGKFGSFGAFQEQLSAAAINQFGSGWGWLVVKEGELAVVATPNQDSPLATGATPILALDVWEHAYYLKYQNLRPKYVEAWWNVINWAAVDALYQAAKG
jgi:Fe-Mn family superoxide dismutase